MPPSLRTTMTPRSLHRLQCLIAGLMVVVAGTAAAQSTHKAGAAARKGTLPSAAATPAARVPLLMTAVTARDGGAATMVPRPEPRGFGQARLHDSIDPALSDVSASTLTARLKNAPRAASPWRGTMRFELSSREQLIIKPRPRRVTIAYQATL
jgi:hypothetical protein